MFRLWSNFFSTGDKALYSESFNLKEERSLSNIAEHLRAAIYHPNDDLEAQKTLTSQLKQREKAMRGEIARLEKQLCIERRIQPEHGREKALEKELAAVKMLREKDREAFNRAANNREKVLEKQLAEVKQLREMDKNTFYKKEMMMIADFEKRYKEKVNNMQAEIDSLKQKLRYKARPCSKSLDRIAELRGCPRQEIKKQNIKIYKLSTELEKTKEELKISENLKESFMKEAVKMKEQMFAKDAERQTLKDKTTAQIQLQQKWELEKKTLLNKLQTMKAENKHVQSELEASQDEIHDQMKIIERLEQIAEQYKMSHEKVLEGLFLKEKALVRNLQDRDRFNKQLIWKIKRETSGFLDKIAKLEVKHNREVERQKIEMQELATKLRDMEAEKQNVSKQLSDLGVEFRAKLQFNEVRALEKEPERKRRKWYQKLFRR